MNFYGVLDAGKSRFTTRNGDETNGVRVAAVIDHDGAKGYLETTMNSRGQWQVTLLPPPGHGGARVTIATGDLKKMLS